MNIKHYLSAAAAITLFAACSDYDPGMSEDVVDYTDKELKVLNEYAENFAEHFGGIDPDHTWGFGEKGSEDEMGTRYSSPNSNMWVEIVKGKVNLGSGEFDGVISINTNGRTIPGFPVQNYYLSSNYNTEQIGDPTKPVRYIAPDNPQNSQESTGTPQNYEGYYHCKFPNEKDGNNNIIEHWFPNETELINYMNEHHFTEVIPLGDVAQCNTLTDAEVADVYAEFSKVWKGTNPEINWDTYFVQQVWKGIAEYTGTKHGGTIVSGIVGGNHMDYLVCDGGAVDNNHFYNFNYSDYQLGTKGMMLIEDGNTTNFGYHCSMDSKDWYNHFRLVELHGNYYVGFDFESDGSDEAKVERDYIYNDWIIKIIPGHAEKLHTWSRIMCEDLGNTYDYDFNDLVYDVYYTGEAPNYTAHIKVQAAGGTYPIFIGEHDNAYEAHRMLGHGDKYNPSTKLYQPINVGTGLTSEPYEFTLSVSNTNPDNILIYVENPDFQSARGNNLFTLPGANQVTNAPQKICIPGNEVKWTLENKNIEWAYPRFVDWVNNMSGDCGFGKTNDWTKTSVQATYLFQ